MEIINKKAKEILIILLKSIGSINTVTLIARELKMSRWGVWKIIKKLEKEGFIKVSQLGSGRTGTNIIELDWNPLLEKTLILILAQEAGKQKRWVWEFKEIGKYVDFTILYGSILYSPKKANDIDIINVASKKKVFLKIDKLIAEKQADLAKKIHDINFVPKEFKAELKKSNKAFIHAIRMGVVLQGHEKFVKFMRNLK